MTPTEALAGWSAGAAAIKLFPASVTGPAFIRELHGPFPEIPVIPTGGVTGRHGSRTLIMAGAVAVGIGSWLTGDGDPAGSPDAAADASSSAPPGRASARHDPPAAGPGCGRGPRS